MEPDLMEVGSTLEEAKQLRREHDELLTKLNVSNTASRTENVCSVKQAFFALRWGGVLTKRCGIKGYLNPEKYTI